MRRITLLRLLFLAALVWGPLPSAQAGEPERTPEEKRAYQAFDRGDYEEAARAFGEAFRVTRAASVKYNEAYAWQRAGRLGPAADGYTAALQLGGLDAERAKASRDRLAELRRKLGSVVLLRPVGGSVTLAHAVQEPIPTRVHVAPGTHFVEVRSSCGGTVQRRVELKAAQSLEVDVATELPACPEPADGAAPHGSTEQPGDHGADKPVEAQWIAGWALLGTGATAGIVAAVLGYQTLSTIADFEATGNTDAELRDEAISLRTWTNVAWIAGAALAATGVVLLLTSPDSETPAEEPTASVRLGPLGASLAVSW